MGYYAQGYLTLKLVSLPAMFDRIGVFVKNKKYSSKARTHVFRCGEEVDMGTEQSVARLHVRLRLGRLRLLRPGEELPSGWWSM